jgi:octaprenyl-diphosphate synthase
MLEAALPSLSTLRGPVADRLQGVEETISGLVQADFGPVNEVSAYLLKSRGKLLRPTLLLVCNEVGGNPSPRAVRLGAIVELMHVATLVHDDAVDHSPQRRGMPTVNSRWSHQVAVIMGDYLYSRALVEVTSLGDIEAVELLANASNRMSIGEMRQLVAHDALQATEEDYYLLCDCKTASLIAATCELGALAGDASYREPFARFGRALGMTFQITDDLLDYSRSDDITGKPGGLDLAEHKVTLPLIAALREMTSADRVVVEDLFDDPAPSTEKIAAVSQIVESAGGLDYAQQMAAAYADAARQELAGLPDEPAVHLLGMAVDYVLERQR